MWWIVSFWSGSAWWPPCWWLWFEEGTRGREIPVKPAALSQVTSTASDAGSGAPDLKNVRHSAHKGLLEFVTAPAGQDDPMGRVGFMGNLRPPDSCHRGVSLSRYLEAVEDGPGGVGEWVFGEVVVADDLDGDLLQRP